MSRVYFVPEIGSFGSFGLDPRSDLDLDNLDLDQPLLAGRRQPTFSQESYEKPHSKKKRLPLDWKHLLFALIALSLLGFAIYHMSKPRPQVVTNPRIVLAQRPERVTQLGNRKMIAFPGEAVGKSTQEEMQILKNLTLQQILFFLKRNNPHLSIEQKTLLNPANLDNWQLENDQENGDGASRTWSYEGSSLYYEPSNGWVLEKSSD